MRVIECNECGEPLQAANDAELVQVVSAHMQSEHDIEADDGRGDRARRVRRLRGDGLLRQRTHARVRHRPTSRPTAAIISSVSSLLGPGTVAPDHAVLDVVVEQAERDLVERGLDRADLRQHVDAVAVLVDHLLDAARLTLDALEAGEQLRLGGGVGGHRRYTPEGLPARLASAGDASHLRRGRAAALGRGAARRRRHRRLLLARLRRGVGRACRRRAGAAAARRRRGRRVPGVPPAARAARRRDALRLRRAGGRWRRPAAGGVPGRLRGVVRAARRDLELPRVPPAARERRVARRRRLPRRARSPARSPGRSAGRTCWPRCTGTIAGSSGARRRRATRSRSSRRRTAWTEFAGLYEQTMRRAGASPFYFFPRATGTRCWPGSSWSASTSASAALWWRACSASAGRRGCTTTSVPPPTPRAAPAPAISRFTASPLGERAGLRDAAPGRRRRRPGGLAARVQAALRAARTGRRPRSARRSTTAPATSGSPAARRSTGTRSSPAYREPY